MTVQDFLDHIEGVHDLIFFDINENYIFNCNSDSSSILERVKDWNVKSFSCLHPVNERAGLKLVVYTDLQF